MPREDEIEKALMAIDAEMAGRPEFANHKPVVNLPATGVTQAEWSRWYYEEFVEPQGNHDLS